jgi:hypothetical protein
VVWVKRWALDTHAEIDGDFFLLFDRDATWTHRPPRPVSSGATVIRDSDRLAGSVASLLR